jgi:DNA modification methylase
MGRMIYAVTESDDVVWEPFGGLASASVAAVALGRKPCVAELDGHFARMAEERLRLAVQDRDVEAERDIVTI